jgi:hypothetical protein
MDIGSMFGARIQAWTFIEIIRIRTAVRPIDLSGDHVNEQMPTGNTLSVQSSFI